MHFKCFPGEATDALALEVHQLIASTLRHLDSSKAPPQNSQYFTQFNEDVAILNKLLSTPPSATMFDQIAYQCQEEFNEMWDLGQKRWILSGSNASVADSVIKQAAQKANQYKEAMTSRQHFKERNLKIAEYLSEQGWKPLLELALQKGCEKEVLLLRTDWIKQQQFAYFNSEDLVLVLKELKNFYAFLNLMQANLSPSSPPSVQQVIKDNLQSLERLKIELAASVAWRLHAASLRGNLWFDDPVWALNHRLNHFLGSYDYVGHHAILSRKLSPERAKIFIQYLQKSKHSLDREKWFNSRWIGDPEGQYPIKVVITPDLEMIPHELADLIPSEPHSLEEFIRYFYFRSRPPQNELGKYLKKKWMKHPFLMVTFLNETSCQLNAFSDSLISQENFVLSKITKTPGFKSALLFPSMMTKERACIHSFMPKNLLLRAFFWILKKLFKTKTDVFFERWEGILNKTEKMIRHKARRIVTKLMANLETSLVSELKSKLDLLPKDLILDLSRFIDSYGTSAQKKRFKEITSPAYLFKQFQLINLESDNIGRLDQGAFFIFLRYTQLYCSKEECEAAYAIAHLLAGNFPKNAVEDERLLLSLSSWFKDKAEIAAFLNYLCVHFIARISSRANPLAYRFLKLYSREALTLWDHEKDHDLYRKYSSLAYILDRAPGSEVNLYHHGRASEVDFLGDLRRDQSANHYMAALEDVLGHYLINYEGNNGMYAEVVFHLSQNPSFEHYFGKRLRYLMTHLEAPNLATQELAIYHTHHPILASLLKRVLLEQTDQAFFLLNKNIHSILSPVHYPELFGFFTFKRMRCLLERGELDTIYEQSQFFNKKNIHFNEKLNDFFMAFFKTDRFEQVVERSKLDWIIEYYGKEEIKEENRYLAIKRFLAQDSKREVVDFVEGQKLFLAEGELIRLFTLERYKLKLAELYESYAAKMLNQQEGGWDPYTQYLIEKIAYPQTREALLQVKKAWLNQFLFFNCPPEATGLPLQMHLKNWTSPDEQSSLATFFGDQCIEVKEMVFRYLGNELEIHERKIKLIDRYFKHDLFRRDPRGEMMHFRMEVLKSAVGMMNQFKEGEWEAVKESLTQFKMEARPRYFLLTHTKNKEQLEIEIAYCERVFAALKTKLSILNPQAWREQGIERVFEEPLAPSFAALQLRRAGPNWYRRRESNSHDVTITRF